jgi:NAD(P)-dependent dehydrogenase (short-subunit alcohol dehydrogenase family)
VIVCNLAVQPFDLENIFLSNDGTYSGLQAYKNSKLANLLFTYELARQLEGSGVKVNAIDPGKISTFHSVERTCW